MTLVLYSHTSTCSETFLRLFMLGGVDMKSWLDISSSYYVKLMPSWIMAMG